MLKSMLEALSPDNRLLNSRQPDSRLHNSLILQNATLTRNTNEYNNGLITREQLELVRAKVNYAVLSILSDMEREGIEGVIEAPAEDKVKAPTSEVIKILFLGANPMDSTRIRIDKELREIDTGLRQASERDRIVLAQRWAVSTAVLQQAILDEHPNIIHFSGHGTQAGIMLENNQGQSQLVSKQALAGLFSLFSDSIRCVVLNACYSAEQAEAIAAHVPFVVGMQASMPDDAAIAFSLGFYRAIGAGRDIEFAFKLGKNAIELDGISGDDLPKLLKKV